MALDRVRRREFLKSVGLGVAAAAAPALGAQSASRPAVQGGSAASRPTEVGTLKDLPKRRLGRTGLQVPPLSFGTAPMGHAFYQAEPFEEVINAALDAGVIYLDTARIYDVAEERLAPILARRRKEAFLVTKTWARTRDECLKSLEKSLSAMKVDSVDLCHMHNVGDYETQQAIGKGGCLDGLREARKRGLIRFIGCTGHLRPERFLPILETGEIDALMVAMNFVDNHTYGFAEKVLPTARKHDCGIIAMKVYGGVTGSWDGYRKRQSGRLAGDDYRQDAVDYALSIPGVATCVIGLKSLDELRAAIGSMRAHKPLEGERLERVKARGAAMAAEWKDHFGPVA